MIIRPETEADRPAVELLTRDAFWGSDSPRCTEHLLVRRLRDDPAFLPELDMVAEVDGELVGSILWARAVVVGPDGEHEITTFGPVSVRPDAQGTGAGGALVRHTLELAGRLGHRAVAIYGHPDYYPRFGFVRGADLGITAEGGATFDALQVRELVPGGLDGVRGELREPEVYHVDPADAEAFDLAEMPAKDPAELTPLEALRGAVPDAVVDALVATGIPNAQILRRLSAREVAALPGVGEHGRDAVAAWFRAAGLPWGR